MSHESASFVSRLQSGCIYDATGHRSARAKDVFTTLAQRSRVLSAAVRGVEGEVVFVEVQIDAGIPGTSILGLPDSAVRESRDRVKAAIHSSGLEYPREKVLVNLAPAHTKKEGPWFDLPIALAVLAASGALPDADMRSSMFVGELGLDGSLRPLKGALAVARAAARHHIKKLFVAPASAKLCALVDGLEIYPVADLQTVVKVLTGSEFLSPVTPGPPDTSKDPPAHDLPRLEDVSGQAVAKRALVIAAAGGHNLLFMGSPGSGKSMLARRLTPILPEPSHDEAVEITQIYDLLRPGVRLMRERPFRAPHHSVSRAGLIGGGPDLRPGEISLAHHGVLFLDELAEFQRDTLESLRQPLEEGRIVLGRARGSLTFPASFQFVAAMNPCPCGWRGHTVRPCRCLPRDISRYSGRASGPLLDRLDLCIQVPPITPTELNSSQTGLTTAAAREAVERARDIQRNRWATALHGAGPPLQNARIPDRHLQALCPLKTSGRELMERAMARLGLTMRGFVRVLRVARTIADLDGSMQIELQHISEALGFRLPDTEAGGR